MQETDKRFTGRQVFRLVGPLLRFGAMLLNLVPRFLVRNTWWAAEWLPGLFGIGVRYAIAKRLCRSCGDLVQIGPGVAIDHWDQLTIGSNVNIHRHCYIDARGGIAIGDNVSIAHSSSLLAFDHSWQDVSIPIKYNPLVLRPISIDSDVWIGCGVRILSGVTLASRTIVAAGAVVTKGDYESGIYGGVPAKLIAPLTESNELPELVVT